VGLRGMAGGQAVDVSAKGSPRGAARRLHREKSTALPAFALLCGAAAAGAPAPSREGLEAFGRGLGWAYQLRDDACDLEEDGRLGRASATRHPLARSLRLLRGACRRLGTVPGLHPEGVEVLTGLARRIVRLEPIDPRPLAEDHPSRRG